MKQQPTVIAHLEKHQISYYLIAIIVGGICGTLWTQVEKLTTEAINPTLALLLYVTFLGVPFERLRQSFTDRRFFAALIFLNFIFLPPLAYALSRFLGEQSDLVLGVLIVLLAPCVDYVLVFTALVGGDKEKLLAATPILMMLQIVLLPAYLWVFLGQSPAANLEIAPFWQAFLYLILIPMLAAYATQRLGKGNQKSEPVHTVASGAMVPLMMLTLAFVVASQIGNLQGHGSQIGKLIPIYLTFIIIMFTAGLGIVKVLKIPPTPGRALILSGVTRNSLVVLPLALSVSDKYPLAPLAVITQTLVELLVMVALLKVLPWLLPKS